jgi:hypothetical protein
MEIKLAIGWKEFVMGISAAGSPDSYRGAAGCCCQAFHFYTRNTWNALKHADY